MAFCPKHPKWDQNPRFKEVDGLGPEGCRGSMFRVEKRNVHAWTFLPLRSPGLVWKSFGIINIFFLPNKITFPLITWKEQAICLQKLQAVVSYNLCKTDFNDINFLAFYLKCACVDPAFFKMHSQNVFIQASSWIYRVCVRE